MQIKKIIATHGETKSSGLNFNLDETFPGAFPGAWHPPQVPAGAWHQMGIAIWAVRHKIAISPMNILAFDTSSSVLSVALKTGRREVSEAKLTGFLQHAENLLPLIDRLLKKQKISLNKIDRFLIGRGPGSFTGLRVGFATLKGFLAGSSRPCHGAASLDMIVENANLPEKSFLAVCLDAGRQRIFFRLYQRSRGTWRPRAKVKVLSVEETAAQLPENTFVTGDALRRYAEALLQAGSGKKFTLLKESFWYPRAATLIHWTVEKPEALEPLETSRDFVPRYFRLSEAEERKKYASAGR